MIYNLPVYINIVFIITTILTVLLFYKATNRSVTGLAIIVIWLAIQALTAGTRFYTVTDTFPPRFILLALPAVLFIIILFSTVKGRIFINSLDIKKLTLLHTVRVPVELCLYWLFLNRQVPQLMTFAGRNFDILAGLTAPLVYYYSFIKRVLPERILLLWNLICLGLLFNIVFNAVLSAPSSFQQFAFDQPNTAILYFPFVWLPCCIVPLVLLAHAAGISKLIHKNQML